MILMGLDAHSAMIKAIFGSAEDEDKPSPAAKGRGATVDQYLRFSKTHNSRYHGRRRGRRPVAPAKAKGGRGRGS